MNIGQTLFTQVMNFVPWSTLERIVTKCERSPAKAGDFILRLKAGLSRPKMVASLTSLTAR